MKETQLSIWDHSELMKEDQYDHNLPHGLAPGYAFLIAQKYGLADPWTQKHGEFDNVPVEPAGLLNEAGLDLLGKAREENWDHTNFFFYKKLGINWFTEPALKHLLVAAGVTDNPTLSKSESPPLNSDGITKTLRNKGYFVKAKVSESPEEVVTPWDSQFEYPEHLTIPPSNLLLNGAPYVPGRVDVLDLNQMFESVCGGFKLGISEERKYIKSVWNLHSMSETGLQKALESEVLTDEFKSKFQELLLEHGLFIGHWYEKGLSKVLLRELSASDLGVDELIRLYEEAYWVNHSRSDIKWLHGRVTSHVFWQLILETIESANWDKRIREWIEVFSQSRECVNCGESFSPINLKAEYYYGSNGNTSICYGCIDPRSPLEKDLKPLISKYVEVCGFPPPDATAPLHKGLTSRVPRENHAELFNAWAELGGPSHVKTVLGGSWFKAMYDAGCMPDGVVLSGMGYRCIAEDGCECNSLDEKAIDDWLSHKGIPHIKEPKYPQHKEYNSGGGKRADWKIGDTMVEYFGLAGNLEYDQRTDEKIKLAKEKNLKLVEIYPEDMSDLDNFLTKTFT